jgi:hypothetical protein
MDDFKIVANVYFKEPVGSINERTYTNLDYLKIEFGFLKLYAGRIINGKLVSEQLISIIPVNNILDIEIDYQSVSE